MSWRERVGRAAGLVDRAATGVMHVRGARARADVDSLSHEAKLARLVEATRAARELDESVLFPTPRAIDPTVRVLRQGLAELTWPSAHGAVFEAVHAPFDAARENRVARARLREPPARRLATGKRPVVVAVHGYMGGWPALDEPQWPLGLFARLGFDVVFPVLPFHGPRAGARRGAPLFPSHDPRLTIEGFRQAVLDVRSLLAWLRARGAPHVGLAGVSLGGYVASLVATIEPALDFVLPLTPLASIADFAREQGRLGEGVRAEELHEALDEAYRVVSPLARAPRVAKERVLVVGAAHDRVTPASHARRTAEHFGGHLVEIPGGHLVQLARHEAWDAFVALLTREGIVSGAPPRP